MFRTWVVVVGVLVGMGAGPERASAMFCQHCGPFGGCELGGAFAFCMSGKLFDSPYCVALGACGGGGMPDDGLVRPRPRGARPAGSSLVAVDDAASGAPAPAEWVLALYSMRMPVRVGFDPFPPGSSAFLMRGVSGARTARGMLAAIASRARVNPERIPVVEESAALGPGAFAGAFATPDGDGYVVRAGAERGATRVRLCALRAGRQVGALADARLGADDVLFVRVRGGGREYALVLTPWLASTAEAAEVASAAAERAAFAVEAGPLTARVPDDGVRFVPSEAPEGDCR